MFGGICWFYLQPPPAEPEYDPRPAGIPFPVSMKTFARLGLRLSRKRHAEALRQAIARTEKMIASNHERMLQAAETAANCHAAGKHELAAILHAEINQLGALNAELRQLIAQHT